jgi:hypothetical protein
LITLSGLRSAASTGELFVTGAVEAAVGTTTPSRKAKRINHWRHTPAEVFG